MGCDAAGTAAEVGDRPKARCGGQLGERNQHRLVQRCLCPKVGKEACIVDGDGVISRPRRVQVGWLIHVLGGYPYQLARPVTTS
jgi:hypothetical protein